MADQEINSTATSLTNETGGNQTTNTNTANNTNTTNQGPAGVGNETWDLNSNSLSISPYDYFNDDTFNKARALDDIYGYGYLTESLIYNTVKGDVLLRVVDVNDDPVRTPTLNVYASADIEGITYFFGYNIVEKDYSFDISKLPRAASLFTQMANYQNSGAQITRNLPTELSTYVGLMSSLMQAPVPTGHILEPTLPIMRGLSYFSPANFNAQSVYNEAGDFYEDQLGYKLNSIAYDFYLDQEAASALNWVEVPMSQIVNNREKRAYTTWTSSLFWEDLGIGAQPIFYYIPVIHGQFDVETLLPSFLPTTLIRRQQTEWLRPTWDKTGQKRYTILQATMNSLDKEMNAPRVMVFFVDVTNTAPVVTNTQAINMLETGAVAADITWNNWIRYWKNAVPDNLFEMAVWRASALSHNMVQGGKDGTPRIMISPMYQAAGRVADVDQTLHPGWGTLRQQTIQDLDTSGTAGTTFVPAFYWQHLAFVMAAQYGNQPTITNVNWYPGEIYDKMYFYALMRFARMQHVQKLTRWTWVNPLLEEGQLLYSWTMLAMRFSDYTIATDPQRYGERAAGKNMLLHLPAALISNFGWSFNTEPPQKIISRVRNGIYVWKFADDSKINMDIWTTTGPYGYRRWINSDPIVANVGINWGPTYTTDNRVMPRVVWLGPEYDGQEALMVSVPGGSIRGTGSVVIPDKYYTLQPQSSVPPFRFAAI